MHNFNQNLFDELTNNGIVAIDNYFSEEDKKNLNTVFGDIDNNHVKYQTNSKDIKLLSSSIFQLIKESEIQDLLKKYLEGEAVCTTFHYSNQKVKISNDENYEIKNSGVCAFHHDDCGKQIKINILISDLEKNSNGLDYAIGSHKINNLDKFILKLFKKFSLFSNWDKHFLSHFINKYYYKIRHNFSYEKKIIKNYRIKKIYGQEGMIYIFDTNGYHRQSVIKELPKKLTDRKVLTLYFVNKEKLKFSF